jgi:hypothetical protein
MGETLAPKRALSMLNPETIAQIGKQLIDALPENAKTTQRDMEKNVRAILQSAFSKLNLVTRDEFDAQLAVLQRTRRKLEQLEKSLLSLEQKIKT